MKFNALLLSTKFKYPGLLLLIAGIILGIVRFYYGIKPDILEVKTFAVYSTYLDSKFMKIIGNNISEELVGIFLLTGLFLLAFARDSDENDTSIKLRIKSLFIALYTQCGFLLFSHVFTFGFAFVYMLMISSLLPFVMIILVYRIQKLWLKKKMA